MQHNGHTIQFDNDGFPDFRSFGPPPKPGDFAVKITKDMEKARTPDYREAHNSLSDALKSRISVGKPGDSPLTIDGVKYTWRHHQDGKTMMLVRQDVHQYLNHTGGVQTTESKLKGFFASPY